MILVMRRVPLLGIGQASGQQLEEAKTINKSLSALGLVRTLHHRECTCSMMTCHVTLAMPAPAIRATSW
jgi:hypothetical protein